MDKSRVQTDKRSQTVSLPYSTKSEVLIYMTAIKEIMELFPKQFLTRNPFLTTLIHFLSLLSHREKSVCLSFELI